MRRGLGLVFALALLAPGFARADATGIAPDSITIGVHAPLSGALPITPTAIEAGLSLYWRWFAATGRSINGRSVRVVVRDDNADATTAVAVCNELVVHESVYALVGFSGVNPMRACAHYASERSIPYLALGGNVEADRTLPGAFALSATFPRQARVAAELIARVLGSHVDRYGRGVISVPGVTSVSIPILEGPDGTLTVGLVREPGQADTQDALADAAEDLGLALRVYPLQSRSGSSTEARTIALQMENDGVDVVVTTTPVPFTTNLVARVNETGYAPRFVSLGASSGFDVMASQACSTGPAFDHASAFSPWPAWSDRFAFDPDFEAAALEFEPNLDVPGPGDGLFAGWGLMKHVGAILAAAGASPTREGVISALDAGFASSTGVYPDLMIDSTDHFGARAAHRLEADCEAGLFREADPFVSGYPV